MHDKKLTYAIKRNNYYTCIATPKFRFLDMNQFIAPGTSYAKFLKAYGVKEGKGFSHTNGLITLKNLITHPFPLWGKRGFLH